jgi:hypothetical protein
MPSEQDQGGLTDRGGLAHDPLGKEGPVASMVIRSLIGAAPTRFNRRAARPAPCTAGVSSRSRKRVEVVVEPSLLFERALLEAVVDEACPRRGTAGSQAPHTPATFDVSLLRRYEDVESRGQPVRICECFEAGAPVRGRFESRFCSEGIVAKGNDLPRQESDIEEGRARIRQIPIDERHGPVVSPDHVVGPEVTMADDLARKDGARPGAPHRQLRRLEASHGIMEVACQPGHGPNARELEERGRPRPERGRPGDVFDDLTALVIQTKGAGCGKASRDKVSKQCLDGGCPRSSWPPDGFTDPHNSVHETAVQNLLTTCHLPIMALPLVRAGPAGPDT